MKKNKVRIVRKEKELFNGKFIDLPIKEQYIINKSIELFDDEDPCIIHQSYVIKEFADQLFTLFKIYETNTISGIDHKEELAFLDYTDIQDLVFELMG
jgi:hypothetical protein